jgi:hypothetical protein
LNPVLIVGGAEVALAAAGATTAYFGTKALINVISTVPPLSLPNIPPPPVNGQNLINVTSGVSASGGLINVTPGPSVGGESILPTILMSEWQTSPSAIGQTWGLTEREVRDRIHQAKQGKATVKGKKNADVQVNSITGEIQTIGAEAEDALGNIMDSCKGKGKGKRGK